MDNKDFSNKILSLVKSEKNNTPYKNNLAAAFDQPEYEGYYVKTDNTFYIASQFDIQWEFGLNKLADVKYAPVKDAFEIYVHKRHWHPEQSDFFSVELAIVNHDYSSKRLAPLVKQVDDHLFQLRFEDLNPNQLLVIRDGNGLFSIALCNVVQRMIQIFSTAEGPAHAVVGNLQDALKSFPDNPVLKDMLPLWEERQMEERADRAWEKVISEWNKYETEEKPDTKEIYGSNTTHEIDYYLSLLDNPQHKEKALSMKEDIAQFIKNNVVSISDITIPERSEVSGSVSRYRSHSIMNLTITMVAIGDEGDVLMRVKGLPNDFDGKVFRHEKSLQNSATGAFIYQTKELTGKNWNTFMYENDGWSSSTSMYPPGIHDKTDVYLDNDESDDAIESADQLFEDYVERLKNADEIPTEIEPPSEELSW